MRMQPDETLVPIVQGSLVPWIRYSVSLLPCQRYMARAPSGFDGPPGTPMPLCSSVSSARSADHPFILLRQSHGLRDIDNATPNLRVLDRCEGPDEPEALGGRQEV